MTYLKYVLLVAVVWAGAGTVSAQELTGRQILDETADRHEQPFEFEVQQMTLIDKSGAEEKREVRRYARKEGTEFKYLIVFHAPAGVRGVALLTWQHDNKEDDQFLYLPAYGKKMKRIAKGGRKNYFMGTDYAFEDLVSESRDKFTYERIADAPCGKQTCFVVKAFPKDKKIKKSSGYKYRQFWVRQDNFFIVRTDFFDRRGKLLKRQTASAIKQMNGKLWRADEMLMENFKDKHKTAVTIKKRVINKSKVPASKFRKRFVTSGKHLRK